MSTLPTVDTDFNADAVTTFHYLNYDVVEADKTATVMCHYALDDVSFTERFGVATPNGWSAAADAAARILFLFAGVSYYKAAAPPVIDLGQTPISDAERDALYDFYIEGLGEYAFTNGLDLTGITITGGSKPSDPAFYQADAGPLIPFGGGIDSIVTVDEITKVVPDTALFIMSKRGDRFEPIEETAAITGLPVIRADRELDPKILQSRTRNYRNGHVPVTGILSALAVLTAITHGRSAVVMSNEWSASSPNTVVNGTPINHQYSKSASFENRLREVLDGAFTDPPQYFSFLRSRSELWVAERLAALPQYHDAFRSCNRAFHINAADRMDRWCGECDKCCFIDLMLSPYLSLADRDQIFSGTAPLRKPELVPTFSTLCGISKNLKPFECVGDVTECSAAVVLAARRPDATEQPAIVELLPLVTVEDKTITRLSQRLGPDNVPDVFTA